MLSAMVESEEERMNNFIDFVFEGIEIPLEDLGECGFNDFCFEAYYAIGYLFRPRTVLEIGTRRGYSLVALCKGHKDTQYVLSCDNESYIEGSQKIALDNLMKSGYCGEKDFMIMSSLGDDFKKYVKDKKFDFVHIDGAHDKSDVLRDLELGYSLLTKDGVMLVHDTKYILDVAQAVKEFVETNKVDMIEIDMYRGGVLIQKREK